MVTISNVTLKNISLFLVKTQIVPIVDFQKFLEFRNPSKNFDLNEQKPVSAPLEIYFSRKTESFQYMYHSKFTNYSHQDLDFEILNFRAFFRRRTRNVY